jgi:hypothetical protein
LRNQLGKAEAWMADIIACCFAPRPVDRFSTAQALFNAIIQAQTILQKSWFACCRSRNPFSPTLFLAKMD